MATTITKMSAAVGPRSFSNRIIPVNCAPADFDAARELPDGFIEFLRPLHAALTSRQWELIARRNHALAEAHAGKLAEFLSPSVPTANSWQIELPEWCADQQNQMTGPADEADLVVKMLNSGAPGVMLDLEDSNGAWTGHPGQNQIAVSQFPVPNQLRARPAIGNTHPDLRPLPTGVGKRTAIRTVTRYRNGVLTGEGASLLDGYMEDLATDRIYRLMIAQRMMHQVRSRFWMKPARQFAVRRSSSSNCSTKNSTGYSAKQQKGMTHSWPERFARLAASARK
jgi:malate synthase